jgi:hypothetical protein
MREGKVIASAEQWTNGGNKKPDAMAGLRFNLPKAKC